MLTYTENKRLSVWRLWRHWWHRKLSLMEEINEQSYQMAIVFSVVGSLKQLVRYRPITWLMESQTRLASYRLFIKCKGWIPHVHSAFLQFWHLESSHVDTSAFTRYMYIYIFIDRVVCLIIERLLAYEDILHRISNDSMYAVVHKVQRHDEVITWKRFPHY